MRRFLRLLIAFELLATAASKFLDLPGFVLVLRGYRVFPVSLLWPLATSVASVELALGAWLISGRGLLAAALSALFLHAGYAAWTATIMLSGRVVYNCGCFGAFLARPLTWGTVVEDLVMAALSWALYRHCRHRKGTPAIADEDA